MSGALYSITHASPVKDVPMLTISSPVPKESTAPVPNKSTSQVNVPAVESCGSICNLNFTCCPALNAKVCVVSK